MRKLLLVAPTGAAVLFAATVAVAAPEHLPAGFSYTEHGRALVQGAGTMELEAGKSLVIQTHVLEPGFRAPWHRHPDSSWVRMRRGELSVAFSCTPPEPPPAGCPT